MNDIRPQPASRHNCNRRNIFVFRDLPSATHVYVRDDTVRGSLQPAYTGPYLVLQRGAKIFKLLIKGKEQTVSIERLKPAYVLTPDTCPDTRPDTRSDTRPLEKETPNPIHRSKDTDLKTTRSGRRVRFPDYYRPS